MWVVDKGEARDLAEFVLASLRSESYDALVGRYLDNPECREISGASGATYQVEILAFWDGGKPGVNRLCRLPRAWDHLRVVLATVMGPPGCQLWDHLGVHHFRSD
jgi:hypothetical protein